MTVDNSIAVTFLGNDGARVLGTPFMIGFLEMTARDSVLPFLDEGYDTVGTRVDVRHLAATPMGMKVTFRSELTAVEDRRLTFKVEAFDDKEKIGEGTHERALLMSRSSPPAYSRNLAPAECKTGHVSYQHLISADFVNH